MGALAASLVAACSLDWAVRADPGVDAALPEGGGDATDAPVAETEADTSVADAADPDGGACEALRAELGPKQAKARECQIGQSGQCTTTVDDECGCKVIVRTAASAESTTYTDAIAAYLASCGAPPAATCACAQLGLQANWACLAKDAAYACRPP